MTVRKESGSRRRRRRTTSKEPHSETEPVVDPGKDKILGIVVHRTDRLRTDLRLRHPFVRVHIIDLSTRSYVRKTDPYVQRVFLNLQKENIFFSFFFQSQNNIFTTKSTKKPNKAKKKSNQFFFIFRNRLALRYQVQNDQPSDHIPGISTEPYDFNTNR